MVPGEVNDSTQLDQEISSHGLERVYDLLRTWSYGSRCQTRPRGLEPRILQFGFYEFDLASRELRKYGARVRLSAQPAKVLELLLSAPQRVVTREEMKECLWPGGGVNDLDHGLNKAVNKVREALCDPADRPIYVETLPKLGYRLLADVREVDQSVTGGKSLANPRTTGWMLRLVGAIPAAVLTVWRVVLKRIGG